MCGIWQTCETGHIDGIMGKDGCLFVRKSSNMMRENRYENHLISNQKLLYMAPKDFDTDFEIFLGYVLKSIGK